jgi:hypothetical protein
MRFLLLLVLAGTASCASTGRSTGSNITMPSERVVATENGTTYRATMASNAKVPIPVPPARAFEALRAVYEELGVPIATNEPASGRVGNTNFWKTRQLGNEPISTYLNCGSSLTGVIADNYRIFITLLSVVRSDGKDGSELETAFTAQAQNMEGTAGDRLACGTTGRLEQRIQKSVLLRVAAR